MNQDDRRLIADTLAGRTAAYGDLVRRYQDRLFNTVVRVVDNPDDAHDIVQETFVSAYVSLGSFKGESEFYTWLYRIAFNTAVSWRRKRRPMVSLDAGRDVDSPAHPQDCSDVADPGATLERTEEATRLRTALARLSPEHREVLVLKDIDGLKYEEIADVAGIPIGTVRSRIHRARLELRDLLESGGGE
ncbi:MAG: sigma-70 family RNA polymerase sigma factor [Gemmataceae bacterium]